MAALSTRWLLWLAPETAHGIAITGLRLWQWVRFRLLRRRVSPKPVLRLSPVGLSFPSRVGLAAGFDKNAQVYGALAALGFGFVEVGTVTPRPQSGNPKPRIWRLPAERALVNALGFNNCGLDRFRDNLLRYRRWVTGVPILANIGKNKDTANEAALEDYRLDFDALKDLADGFVVNLSSPNTPGLRDLQSAGFLEGIARVAPDGKPVFVKLAPDLGDGDLVKLCESVKAESRFAGVVLTNTSRALAEARGHAVGGLSGEPLSERALKCVALARQAVGREKIVIGVGGVGSAAAAKRMREAGADLVEIYTGFIYGGPAVVREIASALGEG